MRDARYGSRRFRLFNMADDFNREAIHIEVDTSITWQRLIRIFERLARQRRLPAGSVRTPARRFFREAFADCATVRGMAMQYVQQGHAPPERHYRTLQPNATRSAARRLPVREPSGCPQSYLLVDDRIQRAATHDSLSGMLPRAYGVNYARNSTFELST
jgi:putative transposase